MGDKDPKSKAEKVVEDVVEYFKSPPSPEPELNTLLKYTKYKGDYYLVPKFEQDAKGQTVIKSYLKMTHVQFNRFIYQKNIEILNRKKLPFDIAVNKYNLEIKRIKSLNASSFRRSETRDASRDSSESRIKIMLENWELQYRNKRTSPRAKREREKILELQRQFSKTKPQSTGEIFSGTTDKYSAEISELDKVSKEYAQSGNNLKVVFKKETFTGNFHDLIDFYESEISFIEKNYLDDMNNRLKSNNYYLNKLK